MPLAVEFTDGFFADNIINALNNCERSTILALKNEGLLRFNRSDYLITPKAIKLQAVDRYIQASGSSASSIMLKHGSQTTTFYTPNDTFVRTALGKLPMRQLLILDEFIQHFYPNSFFDLEEPHPGRRLLSVLTRLPRGSLLISDNKPFSPPAWKQISPELQSDIQRYTSKHNFSPRFIFNSNLWPDWAAFVGVSLHWLFKLSVPLHCDTQVADTIFDRYTLMQPFEQEQFCDLLCSLLTKNAQELVSVMDTRRENIT